MTSLPYDSLALLDAARELCTAGAQLAQRGWTPANSSNFSRRLDQDYAAITISGREKGRLGEADIMVVDLDGRAVGSDHRPSAETLLHTQLYRRFPDVGCVLHTHSRNQTVASRLYAGTGGLTLSDYELLKAFPDTHSHESRLRLPVLGNSQDMVALAADVERELAAGPLWGYLIEGHGLYAWGANVSLAMRHLETFEFLIDCELELRKLMS